MLREIFPSSQIYLLHIVFDKIKFHMWTSSRTRMTL